MNEARKTFEAIALANGGTDFSLKQDGRYAVQKIQSRWTYFRLGWEAKAKREQPEQEPVAVWKLEEDGWNTIADPDWMETLPVGTRLYTAPPKREPDDEGLYTEKQVQRMIELLERCENEMRYAGWTKFESDNPTRNEVYEEVKEFLK